MQEIQNLLSFLVKQNHEEILSHVITSLVSKHGDAPGNLLILWGPSGVKVAREWGLGTTTILRYNISSHPYTAPQRRSAALI